MSKPRAALLITCMVDVFEPEVAEATVQVLEALGYEVDVPLAQTCCGQPAWNSGFVNDAARVATTTLHALEDALTAGAEAIVAPAGSCVTMVRVFWPELFEQVGDPDHARRARDVATRTFEFTEFLARHQLPSLALDAPIDTAWHHSCHLLRELRVREEPLALLDAVTGCRRVQWDDDERCCGFGGTFSVKLPEASAAMADQKLASFSTSGADMVVGADSSCLAHLRTRAEAAGAPIRTRHIAQVVADALPKATPQ